MEKFERTLERPGSKRRLANIQRRFRIVTAKLDGRRPLPFALIVVGVFVASFLAAATLLAQPA